MTDVTPYLSGWQETLLRPGDVKTFTRGEFIIHLRGAHEVILEGRGYTGCHRFYWAARKVAEMENADA